MRILLVNDDGIDAPGIRALVDGLCEEHEIYVCAPVSQRSGYSHSVTYFSKPLRVEERNVEGAVRAWAVDGTPADCAYFGIYLMDEKKPDLVISGINQGQNLSADIVYSGTVGAACEGLIAGVKSIAMSWCSYTDTDFSAAVRIAKKAIAYVESLETMDYVLSVNVPPLPYEKIKGIVWALPQKCRDFEREMKMERNDDGSYVVSTAGELPPDPVEETDGTDIYEIRKGYVTFTPVGLDPTVRNIGNIKEILPEL